MWQLLVGIIAIILIVRFATRKSNTDPRWNKGTRQPRRPQPEESNLKWIWDPNRQLWVREDQIGKLPPVPESSGQAAPPTTNNIEEYQVATDDEINFARTYQARYLLTKNELYNYKLLKPIADAKGYVICPKVRLLDIIEPIRGQKKYKALFYKVQAKHVDFVICDQGMHIKAIIELDDSSHDRQDRQERDRFVNLILTSVGYKVIHTRQITDNIFENI